MTNYFLDTSALAKRYILEQGSNWIRSIITPETGNVIITCDLTAIEFFSVLARRHRENALSADDKTIIENAFLVDSSQEYLSIPLDNSVLIPARGFVGKHLLRPPDAIQLASALHSASFFDEPVAFLCADQKLLDAAQVEGLSIDNPNLHT